MKVSYLWLKDYCDFALSAEELAEALSRRGLAAEAVIPIGNDFCLDLEITANRPDLLCHIGVAREIAAFTGSPLRIPSVEFTEEERDVANLARVEVQQPELCPRYTARVLYDVTVRPAPPEMQRRLQVIGLRPVNNVVDITNYVLMECGQPQHAFDFGLLRGGVVIVRPAEAGEKLELIDGTSVTLAPEHLVIADSERPVALAGIMGGLPTEISPSTGVVLLESAKFHPVNIRRTTRTTGKSSDSSYRFERSVDTPTVEWASRRAAALIVEHGGAKVARGIIDVNFTDEQPRTIEVRVPRIERILGMPIPAPEAGKLLKAIGFSVKFEGHDSVTVGVPSFRPDVNLEIDLIEEVARCHGYHQVPTTSNLPITDVAVAKLDTVTTRARQTLVRLGYYEAVTSSFMPQERATAFSPWNTERPIVLSNPLRADEAAMRQSLVPSLLQVARTNQDRGTAELRIFELNRVYLQRPSGQVLPEEKNCLAIFTTDGARYVKGAVEALLEQFDIASRATFEPATYDFLSPGLTATWRIGNSLIAYMGEVSDEAASAFRLQHRPWVAEIDIDTLTITAGLHRRFRDLPRFPAVARDLAIVVDETVAWGQIRDTVAGAGAANIESISFGEIYRGQQVEPGKKSVFLSIIYRAADRTLTGDEVNASQERVVGALAEQVGATLRA